MEDRIVEACQIINRTFATYPPSRIGVSFNGGKDSVIVMTLLRRCVPLTTLSECFYFYLEHDECPEMTLFRESYFESFLPSSYSITLHKVPDVSNEVNGKELFLKDDSQSLPETANKNQLSERIWSLFRSERGFDAVFMGGRQDDYKPEVQSKPEEKTTMGWPPFIRVCPIFHWTYSMVWEFILKEDIPFCSLYSNGYTSIGDRLLSQPNPELLNPETNDYKPAWKLNSDKNERKARIEKK